MDTSYIARINNYLSAALGYITHIAHDVIEFSMRNTYHAIRHLGTVRAYYVYWAASLSEPHPNRYYEKTCAALVCCVKSSRALLRTAEVGKPGLNLACCNMPMSIRLFW